MSLLAAVFSTSLTLLLILSSLNVVDSKPLRLRKRHASKNEHVVQKRATLQDILGDLTAEEPGILNEDSKLKKKLIVV